MTDRRRSGGGSRPRRLRTRHRPSPPCRSLGSARVRAPADRSRRCRGRAAGRAGADIVVPEMNGGRDDRRGNSDEANDAAIVPILSVGRRISGTSARSGADSPGRSRGSARAAPAPAPGLRRCARLSRLWARAIGGDDRGQVGELLGLQREELVAGLRRLQRAGRATGSTMTRASICVRVAVEILTTPAWTRMASWNAASEFCQRVWASAISCWRGCRGGDSSADRCVVNAWSIVADVVGDALRLAEQLLGLRWIDCCELLQRRIRQAREVARLVDQHLRLVLQRCDLVVDLLQRRAPRSARSARSCWDRRRSICARAASARDCEREHGDAGDERRAKATARS